MIELNGLTKRYGPTLAVDDLSFRVQPGKVTGFLGPNGAGKSTSMRMVLGLDRPTAGQALVDGRRYQELRAPLRVVGALLDARAVHPRRSAADHLLSLARSNGIPRSRVEEVLGQVGLDAVAGRRVGAYSLGMRRQRLGIAAALLGDPSIVLFDEPVNGLDPDGIRWVRQLLKDLAAEGRTVFVIGWPMLLFRAVGAEWTKLRSVRSTHGSLLAALAVTVGIAALAAWAILTDDQPNPATATQLAAVGASVGQFGLVALAALAITSEFATGGIRTTLAATPARWVVLTAKATVVGAVTFPAGLVATALATLAGSTILGIGTDGIGAVSARSAAALTLTSLLVVGLGAVLRSAAGTITTAVAVLFAPPILGALVSNELVATVMDYLPAGLTTVLVSGTGERYSPEVAAVALGAWAVGALAAWVIALHHRDP